MNIEEICEETILNYLTHKNVNKLNKKPKKLKKGKYGGVGMMPFRVGSGEKEGGEVPFGICPFVKPYKR